MRAKARLSLVAAIAFSLAACDESTAPPLEVRPVRTVTVERHVAGETLSLTEHIRVQDEVNLAFRFNGQGSAMLTTRAGPSAREMLSADAIARRYSAGMKRVGSLRRPGCCGRA
jgi:hypothetical protein